MKATIYCFSLFLIAVISGCANVTVTHKLTENLMNQKIYVIHFSPDKRHLERIISDQLNSRRYTATYGEEQDITEDVDIIVYYTDHWMWDIFNYMLDITIEFRDVKTKALIASGKSYRPSLQRSSPENMIKETLDKILTK